jgi:ABC-type multidrug transport system fused ATPase/permease subunit
MSTCPCLLLRFREVGSGRILIGSTGIREVTLETLR